MCLLQPGKVFLIGARPGMGKTTFFHKLMNYLPNQPTLPLVYNIPKTQEAPQIHPLEHMLQNTSKPISILVIDEIQLVAYSKTNEYGTAIRLREFMRYLRAVAHELTVPVVVLAKWPRLCEMRDDHRPRLADLSVTDVKLDDFDAILFLYRYSYYRWSMCAQDISPDDMEILLAKMTKTP